MSENQHPMTITEKIFAHHANKDFAKANDLIEANVDITLANDITGPIAIEVFEKIGMESVFDKSRVVLVPDHFVPNKDIKSAIQAKILRDFTKKHEGDKIIVSFNTYDCYEQDDNYVELRFSFGKAKLNSKININLK